MDCPKCNRQMEYLHQLKQHECYYCDFTLHDHLKTKNEPVAKVPCSDRVRPAVCEWKKDEPYFGDDRYFATECGEAYYFEEGKLDENNYNYCPNCGKLVKQA